VRGAVSATCPPTNPVPPAYEDAQPTPRRIGHGGSGLRPLRQCAQPLALRIFPRHRARVVLQIPRFDLAGNTSATIGRNQAACECGNQRGPFMALLIAPSEADGKRFWAGPDKP